MMDEYCKNYVPYTLCKKVNMHVPKSWCIDICKGVGIAEKAFYPITQQIKKIPINDKMPSLVQMAKMFAQAMLKWAGTGFKLVSREEYIKRWSFCHPCGERRKGRCKQCGCNLGFKLALEGMECLLHKF